MSNMEADCNDECRTIAHISRRDDCGASFWLYYYLAKKEDVYERI